MDYVSLSYNKLIYLQYEKNPNTFLAMFTNAANTNKDFKA